MDAKVSVMNSGKDLVEPKTRRAGKRNGTGRVSTPITKKKETSIKGEYPESETEYHQEQEQDEGIFDDDDDDEEEQEEDEPPAKFEYDDDSEDSYNLSDPNDDYTSKSKRGSSATKASSSLSAAQKAAAKSRKSSSRLDRSPTPDDNVIVAPDTQEMPPEPSADLPRHLFNDAAVRALLTIVIEIDPFQGPSTWKHVYINYSWWSYHHIDPPRRYARMKTCMDKTLELVKVGEKYWNQLKMLHENPAAVIEDIVHFPYSKKTLNLVRTVAGMKAEAESVKPTRRRMRISASSRRKTLPSSMLDDASGDDDFYLTKAAMARDPYPDTMNESDSVQAPSLAELQRAKRQEMMLKERKRPRHSLPAMLRNHSSEAARRAKLESEYDKYRRGDNLFDEDEYPERERRAGKDSAKKHSYSPVQVSKKRRVEITPRKVEREPEPEEEIELDLPEPTHNSVHDENMPTIEDHIAPPEPAAEPEIELPEPSRPEEVEQPEPEPKSLQPELVTKAPETPSGKVAADTSMDDVHMDREATPSPPTVRPSSVPQSILKSAVAASPARVPVTPQPHTFLATPSSTAPALPTTPNLFTMQDLTSILQETNRGVLEAISQMNQALAQKDANTAVLANALTSSTKYMQDLSKANGAMFSVFSENSRRMTEAMAENNKVMMELLKSNLAQQQAQQAHQAQQAQQSPQQPVAQIQHIPASPMNPPQSHATTAGTPKSSLHTTIQIEQPAQEAQHHHEHQPQQHLSLPTTAPLQTSHVTAPEDDNAPVFDALTLAGIYAVTADAPAELAANEGVHAAASHDDHANPNGNGNADEDDDVVMASPASPELGGGLSPVPHPDEHDHEDDGEEELVKRLGLEPEQGNELDVPSHEHEHDNEHEHGHEEQDQVDLAQRLGLEPEQDTGKPAEAEVRETEDHGEHQEQQEGEELGEPATPGADEDEGEAENDAK